MEIVITADGSQTFYSEQYKQHFHSVFGAETESQSVYIDLGFTYISTLFEQVKILEIGFGTGLNAHLSFKKAEELGKSSKYTGIEAYPLESISYDNLFPEVKLFHHYAWETETRISNYFTFKKTKQKVEDFETTETFNLIYFDAFAPDSQPEMWTEGILKKMYSLLVPNGILTTYCSKVLVQKNLKSAGFRVEKHKGPPHKREVIRAVKKIQTFADNSMIYQ